MSLGPGLRVAQAPQSRIDKVAYAVVVTDRKRLRLLSSSIRLATVSHPCVYESIRAHFSLFHPEKGGG